MLKKYCQVVPIEYNECPNVFKEKFNFEAVKEISDSFVTAKVNMTWMH